MSPRKTLSVVVACGLIGTAPVGGAENLVPNASFEQPAAPQPANWTTRIWQGQAEFGYATVGHEDSRSVTIASKAGGDASWGVTVKVRPYSMYRLSGWIKTRDVTANGGRGALFNVHELMAAHTPPLVGTNGWTRVEVLFETADRENVEVHCLLGGWGLATGEAWYDDVRLEWVSAVERRPAVTIDAAKTGEPISKYIYGQFIEHLGRCIYGGIWAEMLEDRKFCYPVGAKESPWKVIGPDGTVEMVKKDVLVGEHVPQVRLAEDGWLCGISQAGLGLRAGREYVGRIVLAGDREAAPIEVRLIWGKGNPDVRTITIGKLRREYETVPLRFEAAWDTDDGRLQIVGRGRGAFRIGAVSLMPADNVHGLRADTLKLLKELDAPIYRWPGGNFVSGYNWKVGLGDRDRRAPMKNPAWKGLEPNDFGIDEFMAFCREVGTEPYVTVNSGLGDAKMAADEVEYANGGADTPMGRLRAANGHAEPYNVKVWSIGNEMYGDWQLGHMPVEKYVKKHNEFAEAMRAVDPTIKLVAVGCVGPWDEQMLANCADHMDFISEHFYCNEIKGVPAHVRQIPDNIRRIADAHRNYRKTIPALQGKNIRIALDEWNYWYGPHIYGELGTRYFLKDALGIAAGLHEYARNSDLFAMANYAQTVNVIGCITTSKTAASLATTGQVLKLYRRHFGVMPVAVSGKAAPLDVAAAWSEGRKTLTVAIVNPLWEKLDVALDLKGASLTGKGKLWQVTGSSEMAYNEPGKEPQVRIEERPCDGITDRLGAAPLSVSVYALEVR
jgi:alpha-N-arabinofuranosidase